MTKSRLEAFSDGVLAIIITIMVLEIKIPHEATWEALFALAPVFVSYLMSFVFIGIYWGNHHHLLHTVSRVSGKIIWSNMALLFTLSLIPFSTGWMGENHFDNIPVAIYGINLLITALTYSVLQGVIMRQHTQHSKLILALKQQARKGYISLIFYIVAIVFAFFFPLVSGIAIAIVSIMWIVPDKHIEEALREETR